MSAYIGEAYLNLDAKARKSTDYTLFSTPENMILLIKNCWICLKDWQCEPNDFQIYREENR